MKKINFALVGCGRIAKRHAELLGFNQIKNARLAAVCDIVKEKAEAFGKKFSVPHYTDMNDMMEKSRIDVVSVLTPSGLHAEHAIKLSGYKKHIIVEKPMALTLSDADNMIKACEDNGTELFVVKQNRFNVPVLKLMEAVASGRFGKMILGTVRVRWMRRQDYYNQDSWRGTWRLDGGVLANQACHHVDLLRAVMGEVESVFAKSIRALADIETEDTAVATIKFKNGALGVIEATTAARPKDIEGSISILGEKGTVEIGGFAVNEIKIWDFIDKSPADKKVLSKYSVNPPNVYGFGHKVYYENIVGHLNGKDRKTVDGWEGRRSLELIAAIYESIETKKEISLNNFRPRKCRLGKI